MSKLLYGKGFDSKNIRKFINETPVKEYSVWKGILEVCYNPKYKEKHLNTSNLNVCKQWLDFANFYDWFIENYKIGYYINRTLFCDIQDKKVNEYNPKNCCFLPKEIHQALASFNKNRAGLPQGVSLQGKNYRANIRVNKKQQYLGTYKTIEEARSIYVMFKTHEINKLADKYRSELLPHIYNKLKNYNFNGIIM